MAEGARLESVCRFPYRGFESHPLRNSSDWPLPIIWGSSSAGRAARSQRAGRGFESLLLHFGCARRGASGALNLQSAIAGSNAHIEVLLPFLFIGF